MSPTSALAQRAEALGIETRYTDVHDRAHDAHPAALALVVEALDADRGQRSGLVEPVVVAPVPAVAVAARVSEVEFILADGTRLSPEVSTDRARVFLPKDLPAGCHTLRIQTSSAEATCTVVSAPRSMTHQATWLGGSGLFVPAYALWDHDRPLPSFGLLARVARSLGSLDTQLVTTLPLYAAFLDDPFDPSPYAPASRLHWNEVYLDDHVLPPAPFPPRTRLLDWAAVATRRRAQLVTVAGGLEDPTRAALDRFVVERPDVAEFARFMTERPGGLGPHDDRAVVRRSHELAQFLADQQLAALASEGGAGLAIDLPIGCHVDGYERWAHPELFASGFTIGAPPDTFFADGQDWGLPPQLPDAGRRSGHQLWRDMLARAGEHAALLRIDHVMAVHRLWWVPEGFGPDQGVYVRYPSEELLAVIAATAATIGTTVVGEDLGTVPPEVSEALKRWNMLGMYEEQFHIDEVPMPDIPAATVAGIRTHDMQPFAAFVAEQGTRLDGYRQRVGRELGREVGAAYGDLLEAVLERLAASRSTMVTVDLDDLVGEHEPHNVPGRVLASTWRRRLDRPVSDLLVDPEIQRRLRLLGQRPARADG